MQINFRPSIISGCEMHPLLLLKPLFKAAQQIQSAVCSQRRLSSQKAPEQGLNCKHGLK